MLVYLLFEPLASSAWPEDEIPLALIERYLPYRLKRTRPTFAGGFKLFKTRPRQLFPVMNISI